MINHIRTLLLNSYYSDRQNYLYPGEEFVPSEFSPIPISGSLAVVYAALFGTDPDRAMKNCRLAQYTSAIHASETAKFATAFDGRLTYWPASDNIYQRLASTPTTKALSVTTKQITLSGNLGPRYAVERLYNLWTVTVTDGSNVTIRRNTAPLTVTTSAYSITNGVSNSIALPGIDNLNFSFQEGVGNSWQIELLKRPIQSLIDIVGDLSTIHQNYVSDIMSPLVEPYASFGRLWFDEKQKTPLRLASVVLTVAYRLNELLK